MSESDDTTRLVLALEVAIGFVRMGERIPADLAGELRSAAREALGLPDDAEARRGLAAMRLALDLETYRAMMLGQKIPRRRLAPGYLHLLDRWPTTSTNSPPTM